jgi:electron transfer flavoprotein alpha/beta subunit
VDIKSVGAPIAERRAQGASMKIVTFVKHVPTQAVTPRIAASRVCIEDEGLSYEVNEADLYAIEEALAQRAVHKGSVMAVTIGPARAKEALTVAYAKGVDQGVLVLDEAFAVQIPFSICMLPPKSCGNTNR